MTDPMTNIERLRETVELLQHAYDLDRAEMEKYWSTTQPELIKTAEGRYILLDALVALVQARTALAHAEVTE